MKKSYNKNKRGIKDKKLPWYSFIELVVKWSCCNEVFDNVVMINKMIANMNNDKFIVREIIGLTD